MAAGGRGSVIARLKQRVKPLYYRGQRLFADSGEPTPYVENVLKFLQEYQAQFQRTQAFCTRVKELDLLEPMQAQVTEVSGRRLALGGFWAVSRARLKAVSRDALYDMAQTDELELLYLHLHSMRNFELLRQRLAARAAADAEAVAAEKPAGVVIH